MRKRNRQKSNLTGKLIVFSVIVLFLAYSFFLLTLRFFGTTTTATILNFRYENFERDETIRNQYTFVYDYRFSVSGKEYEGRSRVIKEPVVLKNSGTIIPIRYLKCCPLLNAPVRDFTPFYKPVIYILVAGVLFWLQKQF